MNLDNIGYSEDGLNDLNELLNNPGIIPFEKSIGDSNIIDILKEEINHLQNEVDDAGRLIDYEEGIADELIRTGNMMIEDAQSKFKEKQLRLLIKEPKSIELAMVHKSLSIKHMDMINDIYKKQDFGKDELTQYESEMYDDLVKKYHASYKAHEKSIERMDIARSNMHHIMLNLFKRKKHPSKELAELIAVISIESINRSNVILESDTKPELSVRYNRSMDKIFEVLKRRMISIKTNYIDKGKDIINGRINGHPGGIIGNGSDDIGLKDILLDKKTLLAHKRSILTDIESRNHMANLELEFKA